MNFKNKKTILSILITVMMIVIIIGVPSAGSNRQSAEAAAGAPVTLAGYGMPVEIGNTSGDTWQSTWTEWKELDLPDKINTGDVYGRLDNLLGLRSEGGFHVK